MPRKNKSKKEKNPLNFHINPVVETTPIGLEKLKKSKEKEQK